MRDGANGRRGEKGRNPTPPPIARAIGYIDWATFLLVRRWVGAGAGNRRNLGAINRGISYFGDPVIRASLLDGEFPYKWELCARNRIIDVLAKRDAKLLVGRISKKNM